jgi:uncharacterized protein (TIGR02001 family)
MDVLKHETGSRRPTTLGVNTMKKTLLSLSIAAAAVSVPAQAADIGGGLDLSGNMSIVSEYVWRGQDQSNGDPSIQGGLDLAHDSGLYVGAWLANVENGDGTVEFDLYGGYATEVAGFGLDIGYIAYMYPGANVPATVTEDFEEYYLGVSKELGGFEVGITQSWGTSDSPDNTEFSVGTELAGFGISAAYGDYDNTGDYYSFGLSKEILSEKWPVEVSLTYSEMDFDEAGTADQDHVVFAVSKSF